MDVSAVDLNLLKAFDALMAERAVTRAARQIGLSQPAMSHALSRLRHLFKDELFIRTPAGMEPTGRAREIAALLGPALDGIRSACNLATAFDPATTERIFRVGMAEYAEIALVERLTEAFAAMAPKATLQLVTVTSGDYAERLDTGAVDAVLLHLGTMPPRLDSQVAWQEPFLCLARRGNPLLRHKLSIEAYAALPHLLVSPRGVGRGGMDGALAERGLQRRIALLVATYLAVPLALARSDLVATVPARTARRIAAMADLEIHPSPLDVTVEITLAWHRRDARYPAQVWLRSLLMRAAAE
jgi:DNA-binding transcriptional LysR family regulator